MASPSPFSNLLKAYANPEMRVHRRYAILAALATTVGLLGLFSLDTPESFARGGFFEAVFGGGGYERAEAGYPAYGDHWGGERHRRHASRHHATRHRHARHLLSSLRVAKAHHAHDRLAKSEASRAAAMVPAPASPSVRRTVCVRACDGYFFQFTAAERGFDLGSREAACNSACPDAHTALFVMPSGADDITQASDARHGELYAQYVARVNAGGEAQKAGSCGCHVATAATPDATAAMKDPTLRKGDMIVTAKGVRVYQGGGDTPRGPRFLSLAETRGLTPARRGALAAIERVLKFPRHHPQAH